MHRQLLFGADNDVCEVWKPERAIVLHVVRPVFFERGDEVLDSLDILWVFEVEQPHVMWRMLVGRFVFLFCLGSGAVAAAQPADTARQTDAEASRSRDASGSDVVVAIIGAVGVMGGAAIGGYLGNRKGKTDGLAQGRSEATNQNAPDVLAAFDGFPSTLDLNGQQWIVAFDDADETEGGATLEFRQQGSVITGEVKSLTDERSWHAAGTCRDRKVCYIYTCTDKNVSTFGAVIARLNDAGNEMKGQWLGYDIVGDLTLAQPVTLHRPGA